MSAMKLREALSKIKSLKPSQYGDDVMVRWLSILDGHIWEEMHRHYEAPEGEPEMGEGNPAGEDSPEKAYCYDLERDQERELLAPFPHDEIYMTWLGAQIDWQNAEYERYNNAMALYNAQLQALYDAYGHSHMAKQEAYIWL